MVNELPTTNTLGAFLKNKRIEAGLTQEDVANSFGYSSPQFISNWERNISSPPVKVLKQLAKMYGITAEEMYEVTLQMSIKQLKDELHEKFFSVNYQPKNKKKA